MQLFVANNQLVGAIPDTLVHHGNLTALDVSSNQLDTLPAGWNNADGMKGSKLNILKLSKNRYGIVNTCVQWYLCAYVQYICS